MINIYTNPFQLNNFFFFSFDSVSQRIKRCTYRSRWDRKIYLPYVAHSKNQFEWNMDLNWYIYYLTYIKPSKREKRPQWTLYLQEEKKKKKLLMHWKNSMLFKHLPFSHKHILYDRPRRVIKLDEYTWLYIYTYKRFDRMPR